jgi:hypothetical protein
LKVFLRKGIPVRETVQHRQDMGNEFSKSERFIQGNKKIDYHQFHPSDEKYAKKNMVYQTKQRLQAVVRTAPWTSSVI